MLRRTRWFIAVLLVLGFAAAPAAAQGLGTISGYVTRADTGAGLVGVTVYVYDSSGALAATRTTSTGGVYVAKDLPAGTYYVKTYNTLDFVDELYKDIQCLGVACSNPTSGTPVPVLAGDETGGIDFMLSQSGAIAGTVTDAGTGLGLADISVFAYSAGGTQLRGATTDGSGNYKIEGLPAGTYFIKTWNSRGYIDELYNDVPCPLGSCPAVSTGQGVDVTAWSTRDGIDFALTTGSTITGSVTNAANGAPIPSGWVYFYSSGGSYLGSAPVAAGTYTRTLLLPGTYYLKTGASSLGFVDEVYNNLPCTAGVCPQITTGTPVAVGSGATVSGIDFALGLAGTINGSVQAAGSGAPLAGVILYIANAGGTIVTNATTDGAGNYTKGGLPAGTYYVKSFNSLGYIDEVYNNVACEAALCSALLGAPVAVAAGSPINGIDFTLDVGGSISGTVRNAATGAPIANVMLRSYNAAGAMGAAATTDAAGAYTIKGMVGGVRYVRTYNALGWVDKLYSDFPCPGSNCGDPTAGTPVMVTAGVTTSPIDFGLVRGGAVSGTVTEAGSGDPLQYVNVYFYDTEGTMVSATATNADGEYSRIGLPAGQYFVGTLNFLGYVDELFDDKPCPGATCDATEGAAVTVVVDETTKDVSFVLEPGGRVTGTVSGGGGGLEAVKVVVYDSAGAMVGRGMTNAAGEYTTTAVPSGTYYLQTINDLGFIDEVFDDLACTGGFCPDPTKGAGVAVTADGTTSGIDFNLVQGGAISGSVWDTESSTPLASVSVLVYDSVGLLVANGVSNAAGAYTVMKLPAGTYYARTSNTLGFVDEFFTEIPCAGGPCPPTTASTPITVTEGTETPGITFWLAPGGAIIGTVIDAGSGAPLEGVDVGVYNSTGVLLTSSRSGALGGYALPLLPAGSYYLRTYNTIGYLDELYDNIPCPGGVCPNPLTGTAVAVSTGAATSGINFALVPYAPGGAVRSDFTGDLTSDLLWRGAGGDLWLWGIDQAAHATDAYVGIVADANWEIKGQGDLNGDGMADLVWRHKLDGTVYYWQMDGATPAAQLYVSTVDVAYDIVGTEDFDGDGKADLLWRNPVIGDLWLWRMNGAEVLGQAYVDTVDLSYAIRGLGDVNGDAKTDVIWQGAAGDLWVWLMNGAVKDAQAYVGTVADASYQIQQVADFDGDLKADLLWWNTVAGDVWIWRLDGADVLSEHYVGMVADTHYRIQAAGDYDGDGKADLLWRNIVAGDLWVWLMNGPVKASEAYVGQVADQGYQIVK